MRIRRPRLLRNIRRSLVDMASLGDLHAVGAYWVGSQRWLKSNPRGVVSHISARNSGKSIRCKNPTAFHILRFARHRRG